MSLALCRSLVRWPRRVGAVALLALLAGGCEAKVDIHSSPASSEGGADATPGLPAKSGATGKRLVAKTMAVYGAYLGTDPLSGLTHGPVRPATAYFLVAGDGTVCRVHMVNHALAVIGTAYVCAWRAAPDDL
jgi:hypothetical protein